MLTALAMTALLSLSAPDDCRHEWETELAPTQVVVWDGCPVFADSLPRPVIFTKTRPDSVFYFYRCLKCGRMALVGKTKSRDKAYWDSLSARIDSVLDAVERRKGMK
jgi:hypothetical protein